MSCPSGREEDCPISTAFAEAAVERSTEEMLQTQGHIHSVETCGTVDGPGLRYVLFLHGCPLRCQYCHNPDAQGKPSGKVSTAAEALADIVKYKNFIKRGGLTISGGIAQFGPDGADLRSLIGRADQYLYHAKDSGRNRIINSDSALSHCQA